MSDRMALKVAIDLMHVPSQVRLFRSEPLPDGVLTLLRIAAGDAEAESSASLLIDRSRDTLRAAATFFIEQILFAPNSDSYRVLGTSRDASAAELRRNVALLLRWLHPDLDHQSERSIFVGRVTAAWNDLKTPQRRAAYDDLLQHSNAGQRSRPGAPKSRFARYRVGKAANKSSHDRSRTERNVQKRRGPAQLGFFRRALLILLQRPVP